MGQQEEIDKLVRVLKAVKATQLSIISIAWKVIGDDGQADNEKVVALGMDFEKAIKEAQAYSDRNRRVLQWLRNLL